ncbi:hypothetical protein ACFOSV_08455 [Algoriphagus namhaensis]|uniref:Uncharacterized protein n=1 Tax=Algoriphagus namhaensis TaxID=915353 RepID=A0ABV8AR74_9BACT
MKKNWKEYSPKDNAWEKIMQKQDFDAQLEQNLKKLPKHNPSDFVWGRIEQTLEKKKRGLIWPPFLIAASLTGLFLLAFYLIRQGAVVLDSEQIPREILAEGPMIEQKEPRVQDELKEVQSFVNESKPVQQVKKSLNREPVKPIQVPNADLTISRKLTPTPLHLEPRNQYIPSESDPRETYHRVAISWGLKEKTKLKLGSQSGEWLNDDKALTAQEKTKPTKNPLKFIIK